MFVILNDQKRQWLGNYMALRAVLLISLIVCSFMRVADAGTRPSVAFLSPDDSRFWQMVAGFMEQVAVDLDVDLEVQFDTDRNRFSYLRMAQQIVTAEEKPDYLIIMCKELVTTQILEQAHGQGVKVFSFNTDVPEATRAAVGMPRRRWIAGLAMWCLTTWRLAEPWPGCWSAGRWSVVWLRPGSRCRWWR